MGGVVSGFSGAIIFLVTAGYRELPEVVARKRGMRNAERGMESPMTKHQAPEKSQAPGSKKLQWERSRGGCVSGFSVLGA